MDPISLVTFVILILLSMFFSGSETALTSIPQHKVDTFLKQHKKWAKYLKYCKKEADKVLMAILIWNNIVNVASASLATTISIGIAQWINFNQWLVIWIATAIVTILILIFWEIVPKTYAQQHSESIWLKIAPFYFYLSKILSPIIWCLSLLTRKVSKKSESEPEISQEEVEAFMERAMESDAVEEDTYENIKKMLYFSEITVWEAMTPRVRICAVHDNLTINQAIEKFLTFHYTRIPVYHKWIDDADRVVTLKELLNLSKKYWWDTKLKDLILYPIHKIPAPTPIDVAMEKFKTSHKHIALVMDEYGWVDWIISLEDIIEEIFGNIQDENDVEITPIRKVGKSSWTVSPFVRIDEFLEDCKLTFEELWLEEEEFDWETFSYLITSLLEWFPSEWEEIEIPLKNINDEEIWFLKKDEEKQLPERKVIIKVKKVEDNTIWDLKISIV